MVNNNTIKKKKCRKNKLNKKNKDSKDNKDNKNNKNNKYNKYTLKKKIHKGGNSIINDAKLIINDNKDDLNYISDDLQKTFSKYTYDIPKTYIPDADHIVDTTTAGLKIINKRFEDEEFKSELKNIIKETSDVIIDGVSESSSNLSEIGTKSAVSAGQSIPWLGAIISSGVILNNLGEIGKKTTENGKKFINDMSDKYTRFSKLIDDEIVDDENYKNNNTKRETNYQDDDNINEAIIGGKKKNENHMHMHDIQSMYENKYRVYKNINNSIYNFNSLGKGKDTHKGIHKGILKHNKTNNHNKLNNHNKTVRFKS